MRITWDKNKWRKQQQKEEWGKKNDISARKKEVT
jgi:hypothetical protein